MDEDGLSYPVSVTLQVHDEIPKRKADICPTPYRTQYDPSRVLLIDPCRDGLATYSWVEL